MITKSIVSLLALFIGFQSSLSFPPGKGTLIRLSKVDKGFIGEPVRYIAEYFTGGKSKPILANAIAREYLDEFPYGKFKDEVEWRLIQLENWDYVYEGLFIEPRQPSYDQQELARAARRASQASLGI